MYQRISMDQPVFSKALFPHTRTHARTHARTHTHTQRFPLTTGSKWIDNFIMIKIIKMLVLLITWLIQANTVGIDTSYSFRWWLLQISKILIIKQHTLFDHTWSLAVTLITLYIKWRSSISAVPSSWGSSRCELIHIFRQSARSWKGNDVMH